MCQRPANTSTKPGGIRSDIWFMMALVFGLGFFIERIEISDIAVPLFLPVLINQGASARSGWGC